MSLLGALKYVPMTTEESAESLYAFKGLALGVAALMLGLQISTWFGFVRIIRDGHADFRSYYTAGQMVRTGHASELFDYDAVKITQDNIVSHADVALPYLHPAYEAVLFVPFSKLSFRFAYFSYLAFNLALLAIVAWILNPRLESLRTLVPWLPFILAVCFFPIGATLMQGQDSIILLALLVGAEALLHSRRDIASGIVLGLGVFRFQIVLPIALLFLFWRAWKVAIGFATSGMLLALLSLWLTGLAGVKANVRLLLAISSGADPLYQRPAQAMPNVRGFLYAISHGWLSPSEIRTVSLTISVVILAIVGLLPMREWRFRIAIVVAALASFHLLVHDLTILALPILLTLEDCARPEQSVDVRRIYCLWTALLTFASPLILFSGINQFYWAAVPISAFLITLIYTKRSNSFSGESAPTL